MDDYLFSEFLRTRTMLIPARPIIIFWIFFCHENQLKKVRAFGVNQMTLEKVPLKIKHDIISLSMIYLFLSVSKFPNCVCSKESMVCREKIKSTQPSQNVNTVLQGWYRVKLFSTEFAKFSAKLCFVIKWFLKRNE